MISPDQRIRLGSSNVVVGRVGLGMRSLAHNGDAARLQAIVGAAVDLGVDLIDVAPAYGLGAAERQLGAAIRSVGRDRIVICTKTGSRIGRQGLPARLWRVAVEGVTNGRPGVVTLGRRIRRAPGRIADRLRARSEPAPALDTGTSPGSVRIVDYTYDGALRSVDESLARLGVDTIDVLLLHDPELHIRAAVGDAYRALTRLRDEGVAGAIGIGVNDAEAAARIMDTVQLDVVLLAGRYTLLDQRAAARALPVARRAGTTVLAAGIFNGGILADPIATPSYDYAPAGRRLRAKVERIAELCRRHDVQLRDAALRFTAAHPDIGGIVLGADDVEQLRDDLDALVRPIPDALWSDLRDAGILAAEVPVPMATAG